MKKIQTLFSITLLSVLLPALTYALTLNPSTFTPSTLQNIANGTTVYLEPGTYNVDQAIIDAWVSGKKRNVTFKRAGSSGTVLIKGTASTTQVLRFNNWNTLKLEDLKFVNLSPQMRKCDNSTINRVTVEGQQYSGPFQDKAAIAILYSENVTVSNCTVKWTYTGWNGKGIASWRGVNHNFINNTISGRLRSGIKVQSKPTDPKCNHVIDGGSVTRGVSSGEEDHGIYAHDLSGITIKNITVTGFTNNAAGGSLKLKNIDDVEVTNCHFSTSGILLRIDKYTWMHLENIWIHDNVIINNSGGNLPAINNYTPNYNPRAIVIENNCLPGTSGSSSIALGTDAGRINEYCSRAGKNGGVYNNGTALGLTLSSGINRSGNYTTTSCSGGGPGNPAAPNEVCFFDGTDWSGFRACFGVSEHNFNSTHKNKVSAVSVGSGVHVIMYANADYTGSSVCIPGGTYNNNLGPLNNATSSFQVIAGDACSEGSVSVTDVSVSPTSLSLGEGQASDLTETVSPSNATNKSVSWSSNNTAVATVNSDGLVTAVAEGEATITVTTVDGGFTATSVVTVSAAPVTGVIVSPTSQVNVYPNPVNGGALNVEVTWSSSSEIALRIFNIMGNMVYSEKIGRHKPGSYTFTRNTKALKMDMPGVYIIEVKANEHVERKKVILK